MRRHRLFTIALLLAIAQTVAAQTPSTLGYQGYLTDSSNNAVANGSYSVTFNLYTASIGLQVLNLKK